MKQLFFALMVVGLLVVGCQTQDQNVALLVYVQVNNSEMTFQIPEPMTVEDFLGEASITLDDNDRIVPPLYTQITDGTRITIVRVEEEQSCETEEIPYSVQTVYNEAFAPNEERISRSGQNGQQRICYRIIYENGLQAARMAIGQPERIVEPIDEIRVVGITQVVEPIPIVGTLAYINNGNAWIIQRSSTEKRRLTSFSDLDSLVMTLSPDGRYVLFTRDARDSEAFVNELWLQDVSGNRDAVKMSPTDVLYAQWLVGDDYTISYSTSEVQELDPGWDALNNVWIARVDPETGNSFNPRLVVPESAGGSFGWWGTVFNWSPDGTILAWSQAEAMGVYDEDGNQQPLLQYANFRMFQNWSWRANVSWSWDSTLIATTEHGAPIGNAPADTSPVFNVVITDRRGNFTAVVLEGAGMWASPQFSPQLASDSQYPQGYLAYLRARDPNNSVYGEYDLVVADRDGSNGRVIFPPDRQPGIVWTDVGIVPQDFVWSPDGRQIAVIYQGDLWIVEVEGGASFRMTFDGGSQNPVWVQ